MAKVQVLLIIATSPEDEDYWHYRSRAIGQINEKDYVKGRQKGIIKQANILEFSEDIMVNI